METLEYHEKVLKKVSFDEEQPALLEWCGKELGPKYKEMVAFYMKDKNCALTNSSKQK